MRVEGVLGYSQTVTNSKYEKEERSVSNKRNFTKTDRRESKRYY